MWDALNLATGLVILVVVIVLATYATWLFVVRLRAGDRTLKSFGRWLLDLWDAIAGI
jgi:hypothetical protein